MGAKRNVSSKKHANRSFDNVVELNQRNNQSQVHMVPKNASQEAYVLKLLDESKNIVFGVGPAGTGKTMLAVQAAVKMFKNKEVDRIVVTRPAVDADEKLGALPGTLEEKMAPWTRPIFDVLREYFSAREIQEMIEEGIIEIAPLGFMRGRTFKKSYIIADEMQNTTPRQMKMLLTRLGEGSYMAVTGDLEQADRSEDNGLIDFLMHLEKKQSARLDIVRFTQGDVERHEAVKDVLEIYGS
jgi:phosphate starvation-inducible PhoH-like protein